MRRNLTFYLSTLVAFGAGIYFLLVLGSRSGLTASGEAPAHVGGAPPAAGTGSAFQVLAENLHHPLAILLLQVVAVVLTARLVGGLFARIGQPRVIGEMVAGILLGPSLLGLLSPSAQGFLFPPASLGPLHLLAQVGVILFMFVVGIDLDVAHLRQKADAAVLVSHASILVPFFFGSLLAWFAYPTLAPAGVPFSAFALFIAVAMSLTAFPVLARILDERGLTRTQLGSTAIVCAAVADVTAWCLLALVVAIIQASGLASAALTVFLALAFTLLMLLVVKPRTARLTVEGLGNENGRKGLVAGMLLFAFAAALFTETIGIHALFGAFLAGVTMPSDPTLRTFLKERLESFSSAFLLPLFFAFTGLRTQIGLLDDAGSWLICAGIIAVAILGKLGGSMAAARWTGMSWVDSFALGALMNTRGLVELIALNIGYDLGILTPRIFAMLVIMALVTTFMTGPLLSVARLWRARLWRARQGEPALHEAPAAPPRIP